MRIEEQIVDAVFTVYATDSVHRCRRQLRRLLLKDITEQLEKQGIDAGPFTASTTASVVSGGRRKKATVGACLLLLPHIEGLDHSDVLDEIAGEQLKTSFTFSNF